MAAAGEVTWPRLGSFRGRQWGGSSGRRHGFPRSPAALVVVGTRSVPGQLSDRLFRKGVVDESLAVGSSRHESGGGGVVKRTR